MIQTWSRHDPNIIWQTCFRHDLNSTMTKRHNPKTVQISCGHLTHISQISSYIFRHHSNIIQTWLRRDEDSIWRKNKYSVRLDCFQYDLCCAWFCISLNNAVQSFWLRLKSGQWQLSRFEHISQTQFSYLVHVTLEREYLRVNKKCMANNFHSKVSPQAKRILTSWWCKHNEMKWITWTMILTKT